MKPSLTLLLALTMSATAAAAAGGNAYSITVKVANPTDSVLYLGQHFRDEVRLLDSARLNGGAYTFSGNRKWQRGIYALVRQDRKKTLADICIDGTQRFSISGDENLKAGSVKVKGCPVNEQMFKYIATIEDGRRQLNELREKQKDPATKAKAEADEKALTERMTDYETKCHATRSPNIFFELQNLCNSPEPGDEVEDKATWYRSHYWDNLAQSDFGRKQGLREALISSPQLFGKVNYFFFGILYYAHSDTVCKEVDRLAAMIGDDTSLLRYVFDFIEPRYFRSTTNIGWDAVWCHLASSYYMKGRCPWVSEGTMHNLKYNYNRISQSIIGAKGKELWMIDTTQIDAPGHWVSSHRFPEKYVILWFWDPDCHHCQEQSAALKVLYDSLQTAPDRRFEVYAVGYESDLKKWKRYIREHDFRWVNVGGPNVNIDYQEAYNVHGAPTMIILNERREIIMNKPIPAKSLLRFLDEYEQQHTNP